MNTTATPVTVTEEAADTIDYYIKVPRHYGQNEMKRLDQHLTSKVAAAVTQDCSRGYANARYAPDEDGLYQVRLLQNIPLARVFTKGILEHNGATVVREEYLLGDNKTVVSRSTEDVITRRVKRDADISLLRILDDPKRKSKHDVSALIGANHDVADETEVIFFRVGGRAMLDEMTLASEYRQRGLKPAAPCLVATANSDDPSFASEHPNGTVWHDMAGDCCYMVFNDYVGVRITRLNGAGLHPMHWMAGVRT